MRFRSVLSFGAFAAIIFFAFAYFQSLGLQVRQPPQRINLSMEVPDINGLVVGANVMLRGVPVGKITGVATNVERAVVDFYVDASYKIPVDSDVRLENLSALGESYIGFVPRTAAGPMLRDGQRFAAEDVTAPPSISELAESVGRVLRQMDPAALQRIVGEADQALPDPTAVLPNLQRTSVLVRNVVTHMDGKGQQLLDNFQTLLRNAEWLGPVLASYPPSIWKIGINVGGTLGYVNDIVDIGSPQALRNFHNYMTRIEHFLDHRSGDMKVLFQTMLPYLNDISGALMNLDSGQILDKMLASVPDDGAVTLHVSIPDN